MALWRDGDWIKFVWNSGIQYTYRFSVRQPLEQVYAKTKVYYESRGCRVTDEIAPGRIDFRRGSRIVSKLSPIPFYSEKWLEHAIRLELTGNEEFTEVSATYDAKAYATFRVWPLAFAQETKDLECLLVNDLRRRPRFARRGFAMGLAAGAIATIACMALIGFAIQAHDEEYSNDSPAFSSLSDRLIEVNLAPNGTHDAFGIILNGDDSSLHKRNVSLAYTALRNNGYAPENIFVFSYEDTTESAEVDPDSAGFCTYAPTYGNIEMVFEEFLRNVVDDADYLTIYVTGHGTRKGRISELVIRDESLYRSSYLSSTELAVLLKGVQPAQAVFIFDQCNGGFEDVFEMNDYLVISRSLVTESGSCRHFAKRLLELLDPEKQERNVSLGEAFKKTCTLDEDYRNGNYTPTMTGPLKDVANEVFLSK